ncbi:MAG: sulfate transporter CysZ [Oceanospirillales bacterium LUC14_002_19_P2]|nr:MAG: sulfate transporter CysZ [Oceanospirillales bacterium LUC14_002_19_P2]
MPNPLQSPVGGLDYFLQGLKRLKEPAVLPFIAIPLAINILVFGLLIWWAGQQFSVWVDQTVAWLPDWLSFLHILLWPLFALTIALVVFFTFTLVANFIAAPFNGFLAEKIQRERTPHLLPEDNGWRDLIAIIPRSIAREGQKLVYYLPRALGLLILTFIPVINLAAPFLWALFSAWMMAVQYVDYPADNQQVRFKDMLIQLKNRQRTQLLAFGGIVALFTIIPFINLIVMPAAVIGATLLWIDRQG